MLYFTHFVLTQDWCLVTRPPRHLCPLRSSHPPPVFGNSGAGARRAARRLAHRLLCSGRREKVRAPWRGESHARTMSAVIAAGCARRGAEKRREMQHQMAAERKAAERKATRKVRRDAASEEQCVADAGRALKVLTAATTLDELSDALRRGNRLKSYLPELRRAIPEADKRLEEMLTMEEMRPANEEMGIDDYDEFMPRVDPVRMRRAEAVDVLEVGTDASQDDMFRTVWRREAFMRWQLDQNLNPDDPEALAEAATRRFQRVHAAYLALREKEESCKENTDLQNTMPPSGGLGELADEWAICATPRPNRHECDIMRFLVGIDTDLFDLPSCRHVGAAALLDAGSAVSAGERSRQLAGKQALLDAISAAPTPPASAAASTGGPQWAAARKALASAAASVASWPKAKWRWWPGRLVTIAVPWQGTSRV